MQELPPRSPGRASLSGPLLQEDTMEESGWKLVHGDVFRPPQYPMILSSLLGSGIQLFCMILIVICEWPCGARVGRGEKHRPESERGVGFPSWGRGTCQHLWARQKHLSRQKGWSSQPEAPALCCSDVASTIHSPRTATLPLKPRISMGRLASFCSQALYDLPLSMPGLDWNQVSFLRKHPPKCLYSGSRQC